MDYVKPVDIAAAMIESGRNKLRLSPSDLLVRGAFAGALLGAATSLAFTGAVSTGQPLVGALIFPVSLVMHVTHSPALPAIMTTSTEVPAE
jgi:formate transporter